MTSTATSCLPCQGWHPHSLATGWLLHTGCSCNNQPSADSAIGLPPGNLELLQQGQLPASHWDWQSGAAFRFWEGEGAGAAADEGPEAEARGQPAAAQPPAHAPAAGSTGSEWQEHASPDGSRPSFWARPLELPHRLASADGLSNQATNYVRGYAGALDYVWYDPGELEVVRPIPLPGVEELQGWIPSERFPSDHLAVCCLESPAAGRRACLGWPLSARDVQHLPVLQAAPCAWWCMMTQIPRPASSVMEACASLSGVGASAAAGMPHQNIGCSPPGVRPASASLAAPHVPLLTAKPLLRWSSTCGHSLLLWKRLPLSGPGTAPPPPQQLQRMREQSQGHLLHSGGVRMRETWGWHPPGTQQVPRMGASSCLPR